MFVPCRFFTQRVSPIEWVLCFATLMRKAPGYAKGPRYFVRRKTTPSGHSFVVGVLECVVAVVHAGAQRHLGVAGGRLLDHQSLAHEDGPGGDPELLQAVHEPLDGVGVGDDRVGQPRLLRRGEVRLDRDGLGGGDARAPPHGEDPAREGERLAPDRLRVGLRGDLRAADEDGLRVRFDEGVEAQGARRGFRGRRERPLARRGDRGHAKATQLPEEAPPAHGPPPDRYPRARSRSQ